MKEKSLDEQIEEAIEIKEMFQHSKGWLRVRQIIDDMRQEAFDEWSSLPLDASAQKIMETRCSDSVLRKLLDRIKLSVELGEEAHKAKEEQRDADIKEAMFLHEKSTDVELDRLSAPQTLLDRIFGKPKSVQQPEAAGRSNGSR